MYPSALFMFFYEGVFKNRSLLETYWFNPPERSDEHTAAMRRLPLVDLGGTKVNKRWLSLSLTMKIHYITASMQYLVIHARSLSPFPAHQTKELHPYCQEKTMHVLFSFCLVYLISKSFEAMADVTTSFCPEPLLFFYSFFFTLKNEHKHPNTKPVVNQPELFQWMLFLQSSH